jgi:tetratricopeptide (TPR) repeat protein
MDPAQQRRRTILICALLSAATLATFWPVIGHNFVSYDDTAYITENPHVLTGLSLANAGWAFRTSCLGNWHPLTMLSHMLDVQLFGLNPGGHHLTSLLFHAANAALLFLLLQRMTDASWRSAFVAAMFALHPLHVQSVAWAAERKDVLSTCFFMLTLLAYVKYTEKAEGSNTQHTISNTPHVSRFTFHAPRHPPPSFYYVLALVLFALGLMSKPMLVTVPFVLLLLDYWPLQRLHLSTPNPQPSTAHPFSPLAARPSTLFRLSLGKLPFLALSAASSAMTLWAQSGGGAVVPVAVLPFPQRLANAILAYVGYLEKMFWPAHLTILYPLREAVPTGTVIFSGAVLATVTAWVAWNFRRRPYLAVGWFWFLGMLVPVIGLVQVGMQRMADRYTYLPLIGVFVMLAWEIPERLGKRRLSRKILAALASLTLLACVAATNRQLGYWKDSEHLFGHALEVAPANYIALDNYGRALLKQNKLPEALQSFAAAVALAPDLDAARCDLGTTLLEQGKYDEAADQFLRVLELQPDHVAALLQLGLTRGRQGRLQQAAEAFSRALRLRPNDASAHNNLGNVLAQQGKHEEAVRQFEETVRLQPDHAGAHNNLAISCKKLGRIAEAIAHYREALRLEPNSLPALNNLAWTLAAHPDARFRNGAEAVGLATRACELTKYQNPTPLATLAAAYAETGQFREAVSFAEQARAPTKGSQGVLADRLSAMLESFRAGRPYHAE